MKYATIYWKGDMLENPVLGGNRKLLNMISCFSVLALVRLAVSQGDPSIQKPSQDQSTDNIPLKLRYDAPKAYGSGTKSSALLSDFKCGEDGTVFYPIIEDSSTLAQQQSQISQVDHADDLVLTGLTPSGDVMRFTHDGIPGMRNLISEARYFVSNSRVYTLELADIFDPADPTKTLGRAHLILIYSYKGEFKGYIRLDPGIEPANIAAFDSGDVLVTSLDQLNHTARLLIFDSSGRQESELRLFDEDSVAKMGSAAKGIQGLTASDDNATLFATLALAQWAPFGENLLFTASQSKLPVLEINEHGLVHASTLALHDGEVIGSFLPSSVTALRILGGHLVYRDAAGAVTQTSSPNGKIYFRPNEIEEFNPIDGSLRRAIEFNVGLIPVCAKDDTYTFVTPRQEDGRIQLIRGTVVY